MGYKLESAPYHQRDITIFKLACSIGLPEIWLGKFGCRRPRRESISSSFRGRKFVYLPPTVSRRTIPADPDANLVLSMLYLSPTWNYPSSLFSMTISEQIVSPAVIDWSARFMHNRFTLKPPASLLAPISCRPDAKTLQSQIIIGYCHLIDTHF